MKVLLVEPDFPFPNKSKQRANEVHKNFVPIGLLKLGAFYKSKGYKVKVVRGNKSAKELNYFEPDIVGITSLFTYWSEHLWNSVEHYRGLFPKAEIKVGGIYVTLHHATEAFRKKAKMYDAYWHIGVHDGAEKFYPDYRLIPPVDYHLTHAMRGCIRRCAFCGTWRIEPKITHKKPEELIKEIQTIGKNKVIFLDNNFFANPYVKDNLRALAKIRVNEKPVIFESQSGFDARLIANDPELAILLKQARFQNVRIAWDHGFGDRHVIQQQIKRLTDAGFTTKDISVFMIYNFDIPFKEMLKKLNFCKRLGVQITDCRYRPLESTFDNYDPHAFKTGQTERDYYIHSKAGWTDAKIRDFRSRVREHNIAIRYGGPYNKKFEKWSSIHNTFKFFSFGRPPQMQTIEKSQLWQKRISDMAAVKNYCQRTGVSPRQFDGSVAKFDTYLRRMLSRIRRN